jgi:hypothetical protein
MSLVERGVKLFWFISTLLITANYIVAWFRLPVSEFFPTLDPIQLHFVTSIPTTLLHFFTALGILFYFIGSGVWIKDQAMSQAAHNREKAEKLYEIYKNANKLKGRAFPFPTFSIFFGIMTFVLGGALHVQAIPLWVHPTLATLLVAVSLASFPFVYPAIDRNIAYLDEATELLES